MARSIAVRRLHLRVASAAVILWALAGGARSSARAAAPAPADPARLLDTLLDRAASTAPGTYVVTATAVEPEASALPIVVQADVMRGPEQTIRAAIVLGAQMPQAYVARVRVLVTSGPSGAPQVAGDASGTGQAGSVRLVREFTLTPGEYDVYAAVGHARPGGGALVSLSKSRLIVPDVWRGPLAVTPIVLGEAVGAVPRGAATRPFEFEPTAIIPAASDRFGQNASMHVAFRAYNWTADQNVKPDLAVEYVYYQRGPRGSKFFNKMKPQRVNADTAGPAFDPADGAVTAGMSVPLASFPPGEFELRVRVTDNNNKQSAERRVSFAVAP